MGREPSLEERDRYEVGARALGAAFQKVNFLRDLKADFEKLGRSYFPLLRIETFNDAQRDVLVDDIRNDLQSAKAALRTLPRSSRRAVAAALWFFYELNQAIAKTPAAELLQRRIRVNNFVKTVILIKAAAGVLPA